jgi:hypothetical protein
MHRHLGNPPASLRSPAATSSDDIVAKLRAGFFMREEAADEIEQLRRQVERLETALDACRKFLEGMLKPVTVGPFIGTISSYHPCYALLDKIKEATSRLSSTEQNPGAGAEPATAEATHGSRGVGRTGGSIPPTGAIFPTERTDG